MTVSGGVVLVADDEPAVADAIADALRPRHEVRVAHGGEAALRRLDGALDVALLDRRMPARSGEAVLAAIRERGIDCRVAMVTAVDADLDVVEMPFDDYVAKPVSAETVRSTVDRLLRRDAYDERVRELYSLAAKRAALAAGRGESDLAGHPEYEALRERFERLDAELTETVHTLEAREAFETATRPVD